MTNKKRVIAIIAVIFTVLFAFIGGQTFSKYVTQIKGEGNAEVAKWSFLVNGQEEQIQTIDLTRTCDESTLLNGKIAPGVFGKFDIVVDATGSEVGIDYKVEFENETEKPTNLKFTYQNVKYDSIEELEKMLTGTIAANEENKVKTIEIYWKWEYETGDNIENISQNDIIDTQDAKKIENYAFDVSVIGTQVVPQ